MDVSLNATAVYLALTTFLMVFLAWRVTVFRRSLKIGRGDGGDAQCETAIRAHANLVENAPWVMLLMAVNELQGTPGWLLHLCGVLFLAGRLAHARGYTVTNGGYSKLRVFGMAVTWLVMKVLALALLVSVI